MPLTDKYVYEVEITETDQVQVRTRRIIMDGKEVISSSLHRKVIAPGDDYSGETGKVRRAAAAAHVPTAVERHQRREAVHAANEARDAAREARRQEDTPETEAAEAAAEQALLDAEAAAEAAEAAHEAFLAAEDQ